MMIKLRELMDLMQFKQSWDVVQGDIVAAVTDFFTNGKMSKKFNITSVTLVPKVPNPTRVKDFRPIAYCSVVYKIVSKILTARLQRVIGDVVQDCQTGFIPGRQISDNILLATELIKGYTRANISPRCMLKVDMKKAYDSIEYRMELSI